MNKVYQTKFGGSDEPEDKQGDCFQACLASILEIPYDQAFSCVRGYDKPKGEKLFEEQPWYKDFNKWLERFGLASIYLEWNPTTLAVTSLLGYHIAEVKSNTLANKDTHAVVIHNGDLAHDPNPNSEVNGDDLLGVYLLVPLDVSKLRKPLPVIRGGKRGITHDRKRKVRIMKETNAYRSEYLVVNCPYCDETHYLDIADDFGDGNIPESGRKMTCKKCGKIMLVTEN